MVLHVFDIVGHDELKSEWPRTFDGDGIREVLRFDVFDDVGDVVIIRRPQIDHGVPVRSSPLLQINPVVLRVAGEVQMWLLHHAHELLLIVARRVDEVTKHFLPSPLLRTRSFANIFVVQFAQHWFESAYEVSDLISDRGLGGHSWFS